MKQFILNALILWATSLVPVLLPVMIISRILIGSDVLYLILKPFLFLCRKLQDVKFWDYTHPGKDADAPKKKLGLSVEGFYAILVGFGCGFPMGVKTLADLLDTQAISSEEAQYLACFINNVSPAFLIGFVCQDLLHTPEFVLPCAAMIYGASLVYGMVTLGLCGWKDGWGQATGMHDGDGFRQTMGMRCGDGFRQTMGMHGGDGFRQPGLSSFTNLLDASIEDSITQMLKIGGYLVVFSILSFVVCRLTFLPDIAKASISAVFEISLGSRLLTSLSCSFVWKFVLLVGALSFGGLCSAFQSTSYLKKIGVSMGSYLKKKVVTAAIAVGFCLIYVL